MIASFDSPASAILDQTVSPGSWNLHRPPRLANGGSRGLHTGDGLLWIVRLQTSYSAGIGTTPGSPRALVCHAKCVSNAVCSVGFNGSGQPRSWIRRLRVHLR